MKTAVGLLRSHHRKNPQTTESVATNPTSPTKPIPAHVTIITSAGRNPACQSPVGARDANAKTCATIYLTKWSMPAYPGRMTKREATKQHYSRHQLKVLSIVYLQWCAVEGKESEIPRKECIRVLGAHLGMTSCPDYLNKNSYNQTLRRGFYRLPIRQIGEYLLRVNSTNLA